MSSPTTHLTDCLIGLGSNLGDRQRALEDAIASLRDNSQLTVTSVSPWYVTPAIGGPKNQGEFLNGAALLQTAVSPKQLLGELHEVESRAGRARSQRWAPRPLDLDLLLYGSHIEQSPAGAVVPHPWLAIRPFVLRPALEVAPQMIHPQLAKTIAELWQLATRRTTIIAILQPTSTDQQKVAVTASLLRRCADQAGARFVSLLPQADVGLPLNRRIQFMAEAADLVTAAIADTSGHCAMIFHGWWDQVMLEPAEELPTELVARRNELASTIPVPNVTMGLLPTPPAANRPEMTTDLGFELRFDRYLAGLPLPWKSPFLKNHDDADQIAHDLSAILRGFAETDLRPAG